MRTLSVSVVALTLILAPAIALSQTPQTYSLTQTMAGGMTVQVARDGSKESVEQTVAPGANGPGMHIRSLYDFAAKKVWTMNLAGGPCSVVAYTSPGAPSMLDPIAGAQEMQAGLAQAKPQALRSETVNGIATKVYEMPVPESKGKMRMFLEEKHSFAVKMAMVSSDGKEQTQMEITRLSFDKPAADLFVPAKNCEVQAGETNATGGHVEANVGGQAQAERKLPPAKPAAASQAPKAAAAAPEIEMRGAGVGPMDYTGPAPAAYTFSFAIDASGPVEATWTLVSQTGTAWASGKLVFEAAGSKDLNVPVKLDVCNGKHWAGAGHLELMVAGKKYSSTTMKITADCKAK
ncbi:MAG: hypothetical protein A3H96_26425 [Acidobacteria bacterium RIFCSPLOWO2_02_FULL_67_36]|nr:MAG: hypothetical protein A3H96_26425 [Acidobacteria bacterium RIFCSPLOWO2_02_FULL_67_36]OFW22349.1 MAG: hypothetical protein A3G21_15415 [Acidobacteria bacterium RIFCSPLOWO2_12_FULL_66_21]